MAVKKEQRPFLEHVEAYLARRDGVDKALKILRYTTKLLLASPLAPRAPSEVSRKLKDFEASVGTSRKAFRLGKFIQNVNALKKTEIVSRQGFLGLVANGGEGFYFFVEQFIWLVRSGTFFLPSFLPFFEQILLLLLPLLLLKLCCFNPMSSLLFLIFLLHQFCIQITCLSPLFVFWFSTSSCCFLCCSGSVCVTPMTYFILAAFCHLKHLVFEFLPTLPTKWVD